MLVLDRSQESGVRSQESGVRSLNSVFRISFTVISSETDKS